jgi:hypothetical protein
MAQDSDSSGLDLVMEAQGAVQLAKLAARVAEERESQRIARLVIDTRIISYLACISSLPRELSLKILRAAVASERPQWRPTDSESIDTVVDEFYAWPSKIDAIQRKVFQKDTESILLETAIFELPAHFISQGNSSMVPVIPKALEQNGEDVRHLVLDLRLDDRDSAYQRKLNRICSGMDALKVSFPRLKVCVVSFFPKNRDSPPMSFAASKLGLRCRTNFTQSETLETSLANFINVFYQRGPGTRKLVRFLSQPEGTCSHAGPLVDVTDTAANIDAEEALRGEDAPGEASVSDVGIKVLRQAYRFHRKAVYRNEIPQVGPV